MTCHKHGVDFCDSEGIWLTAVLSSRDPVCIFSHCAWSCSATQHQRGFLCHVLQLQLGAHPLPFQLCQKSLLNWKSRLLELSFLFSNLPLLLWIFMSLLKAPFSSWAVSGRSILSANPYARFSHCLRRDLWQEGTTTTALLSLRWGAQALKFAAPVTESQNHLCWKGAWAISTSTSCAGPWSWVLKTSKDGSFTTSLGNLSLFFATPMWNFFLICSQNLPSVVSDYCTTSSHSVLPDRAWLYWRLLLVLPEAVSSPGWASPMSLSLSSQDKCRSLLSIRVASTGLTKVYRHFSGMGMCKTGWSIPDVVLKIPE